MQVLQPMHFLLSSCEHCRSRYHEAAPTDNSARRPRLTLPAGRHFDIVGNLPMSPDDLNARARQALDSIMNSEQLSMPRGATGAFLAVINQIAFGFGYLVPSAAAVRGQLCRNCLCRRCGDPCVDGNNRSPVTKKSRLDNCFLAAASLFSASLSPA